MVVHVDRNRCYLSSGNFLLVLTFFSGSVLSGCNPGSTSDFARKQQTQENAIAVLTDLGAKITKLDKNYMKGMHIDLTQVPFTPKVADQLKVLESSIKILDLCKTLIDDSQLADLIDHTAIASVVKLDLSHNPTITDRSIEKFERLHYLRDLNLTETEVTEAGIARLREKRKRPNLRPDVTDEKSARNKLNKPITEFLKREFKIRH